MKWTATILFALAATLAHADYPAGTTDSDLLRSGTPVVTNAWLAVSNDTARLISRVAGDASRITDGTNMIDAARNVWQSYSGRVCTNASEAWTYVVGGVTYTAEQMAEAVGGGDSDNSQTLVWMNSPFMGRDEEEEYEGWFILNGSGTAPLGYSYATGEIPESSADPFLALSEYEGFNYAVGESVPITAYRGTFASGTNYVGRLALTNDIPTAVSADLTPATNYANQVGARVAVDATNYTDVVASHFEDGTRTVQQANFANEATTASDSSYLGGYDGQWYLQESTNAAIAVADTKISTNNAAFVAAVTNCPVSHQGGGGADWPIGDFGQYGTIGAIIAALVAASTWLKSHLRYELHDVVLTGGAGTLLDRAGNRVVVTGATTLTLPAAVPGHLRDFLVRLEISGSTVPTITFAAPTGEEMTYETDGDEFPVPDEAGTWSYSFTENCVAHKFAVALKKVNTVAQGGS